MNKKINSYLIKKILGAISQYQYTSTEKLMIYRLLNKLKLKNE